jgi:hypothetical protein
LPHDLLNVNERFVLHDGILRGIQFDSVTSALTVQVTVDDGSGGARELDLRYGQVCSFRILPWTGDSLSPRHGLGDLGYDEVDLSPDGTFEHRLLFSSGTEIEIRFSAFSLGSVAGISIPGHTA